MNNSPYRLIRYAISLAVANIDEIMEDDLGSTAKELWENGYFPISNLDIEDWMYILEAAAEGLANEDVLTAMGLADDEAGRVRARLLEVLDV